MAVPHALSAFHRRWFISRSVRAFQTMAIAAAPKPIPIVTVSGHHGILSAAAGFAARKLGQYAAREVGHLKDVHSTHFRRGDTKSDPLPSVVLRTARAGIAGERPENAAEVPGSIGAPGG